MDIFEIRLTFLLPKIDDMEQYSESLFESEGLGDAFFGISDEGILEIECERSAINARTAFQNVINDVNCILPDATFMEAFPDMVGISDLAFHLSYTRQNIRKIIDRSRHKGFPTPIHQGSTPIWNLAAVLKWLVNSDRKTEHLSLLEVSTAAMKLNVSKAIYSLDLLQASMEPAKLTIIRGEYSRFPSHHPVETVPRLIGLTPSWSGKASSYRGFLTTPLLSH